MASKRQKKKQAKQRRERLLSQAGYSPKQQKRADPTTLEKEYRRLDRNEKAVKRTQTNRRKLLKMDIPLSIITAERLDRKSLAKLSQKDLADARLRGKKLEALKEKGIPYSQAKKDLRLSWDKLAKKYGVENPAGFNSGKVYTGDTALYIGFAQKVDDFKLEDLTGLSDQELIERIKERYEEAQATPDDSGTFAGVFTVYVGSPYNAKYVANQYFERGYKFSPGRRVFKTDSASYSKVTLRSDFSQRRFHELIYTCISQMRNDRVEDFMVSMKQFCDENGFPFYRNLNLNT